MVRGVGVAVSTFVAGSTGFDGLFVIKPDGKMYIQSGVGNLGTESFSDVHRVAAEMMGVPWEKVRVAWGDTSQNLPWTCVSGGSQTTHAMTRAAHAAASDAIAKAEGDRRADARRQPRVVSVANGRVSGGGRSLTLAEVAHDAPSSWAARSTATSCPTTSTRVTVASANGAGGAGPDGRRPRHLSARRRQLLVRRGVRRSRSGRRDRPVPRHRLRSRVGDSGTIIHPRAYGGQLLGRSVLGMGARARRRRPVYDQHYGLSLATRFYQNRPPTILDVPREHEMGGA